jgi:hypothetical protein
MTKKQLIALADHIRRDNYSIDGAFVFTRSVVESLADFCATQNPQFNRERWLDYIAGECGPNGGSTNKHADER